jgi:2,4'-dihydroxyacetophenone dioxygenase
VATDEDRYYVPFTETVGARPLWVNVKHNSWADILRAEQPGLVNRHYHPHEVFAYTISGKWGPRRRPGGRFASLNAPGVRCVSRT